MPQLTPRARRREQNAGGHKIRFPGLPDHPSIRVDAPRLPSETAPRATTQIRTELTSVCWVRWVAL